uniref:Ig-like domain-containing protein n=1 Tax=Biomphalaria glabrata TaxID=6526 RepID=A0A2C9JUU9_BIOGL
MFIYQLLIISVVLGLSENMECQVNFETSTSAFIFITCKIKHFSAQQTYSVNFTYNSTRSDDVQKTKLKCTSLDDYWPVTCLLKVNTTNLHSGFYGIEIIVSADVNNSKSVAVDSYGIHIYAPIEPQTPECKIPNYNDVCSMNRKDRIESSYISCVAAVPFAKVNCSMIDTSKSTNVTITSYEAQPLLVYQNGIYTYTATCEIPFNATMLADGLNINITYSQVTDYDNTSLVSYSSASFSFRCPKVLNFTVNASPDGVCVNIGENVTFRCDSDMSPPSDRIALSHGYTTSNFQGKDITLTIKDTSDYGNYMCSVGYSPYLLKKSVYLVAPEKALRRNQHTFYELHYTGKNNDTAFVLIGVTGCPEPTTITVLKKTDEDVKESNAKILTKGVLVTYTRDPTLTWSPIVQYKLSGNINVTFLNKDMTDNLPEYSLNVSNGISYSVIDFGVYNSDALHLSHSTAVCLLCVVILQALLY